MPLGIICCPRQSTAIQPQNGNYSGLPHRLLAHHRLFCPLIALLSRPPTTGAAQRAPYEPRLPVLKISHGTVSASPAAGPAPRTDLEGGPSGTASPPPAAGPAPRTNLEGGSPSTNGQMEGRADKRPICRPGIGDVPLQMKFPIPIADWAMPSSAADWLQSPICIITALQKNTTDL